MKLKALFALIILTAAIQSEAKWFGGHDGNGGGGFCNQGVCKTAAEAGIQIKGDSQNPGYWNLSADVIQQAELIIAALPFGQGEVKKRIFATPSTFVVADSVSWSTMRRIKSNYKEVMKNNNFSNPGGELEIFAISDSQYTYLLPSFFKLNSRQKTLILIHEGNIRAGFSLSKALEFDSLLLSYLQDRQGINFDLPRFLGALQELLVDWHGDQDPEIVAKTFSIIVDSLMKKSGRSLTLANFRDDEFEESFPHDGTSSYMGKLAISKSANIFGPRFLKMFGNAEMTFRGAHVFSKAIYFTHKIDATKVCRGLESKPGLEKWPLITMQSTVFVVNCARKLDDGNYGAVEFTVENIDFGNIKE